MSVKKWVMSDGNWVTEIEWWKMLNQTSPKTLKIKKYRFFATVIEQMIFLINFYISYKNNIKVILKLSIRKYSKDTDKKRKRKKRS